MFKKLNLVNNISVALIFLISGLYFFKYSGIYLGHPFFLSVLYIMLISGFIYLGDKLPWNSLKFISEKILIIVLSILVLGALGWVTFMPRFGNVGRLPAIVDWIDRFFSNRFPYNSPITPSGFPFLYFLAMPFYFLKNVGYLEIFGLILFSIAVIRFSHSVKETAIKILMLLIIPVVYYELVVRGELFANAMFALFLLIITEKYLDVDKINLKFILSAIIFGLVLSTRSVVGLVYVIYILYYFRGEIKNGIIFSLIAIAVFILILVPFVAWDYKSFINNGPFAIQAFLAHLPIWVLLAVFVFTIYAGLLVSNIHEVFFAAGVVLFLPVFFSMIFAIADVGFYKAVVGDVFDLSYYVFCVPFLVMSISEYRVAKPLGKILLNN